MRFERAPCRSLIAIEKSRYEYGYRVEEVASIAIHTGRKYCGKSYQAKIIFRFTKLFFVTQDCTDIVV